MRELQENIADTLARLVQAMVGSSVHSSVSTHLLRCAGSRTKMGRALCELRDQRDRAARETLAFAGWRCSRPSVARAIEAMLANSHQSTPALGWLLRQIDDLRDGSDKEDAMTKVLDLSFAIAAYVQAEAAGSVVVPFPSQSSSMAIDVDNSR